MSNTTLAGDLRHNSTAAKRYYNHKYKWFSSDLRDVSRKSSNVGIYSAMYLKQTACPTKASLRSEIQEELDTELLYEYDEETSEHQCIPTALVMDGSLEPRVTPGQATLADVVDRAEREYEEKQINKLITEYELIDHQTETAGGMEDDADFEMVNPDRCML
ncbi:unnamed protein product [Aspergillus oryzae]|nr:unnamed protein product [Aspergillus oryzae]